MATNRANLESADKLLAPAVLDTVAALAEDKTTTKADAAAARLAVQYAEAIDEAHRNAAWADRLLAQAPKVRKLYDDDAADEWEKEIQALQARLSVKDVLFRLGPKLAALLEQLGATPRARAATQRVQGGAGNPPPSANPLDALRAAHQRGMSDVG